MLCVVMLNVAMLNVVMLNVVMPNVVMLNVVALWSKEPTLTVGKLKVLGLQRALLVDTQLDLFVCLSKLCRNSVATYFPNTLA